MLFLVDTKLSKAGSSAYLIFCYLLVGGVGGEVEGLSGGGGGVEQARAHRPAYQLVEGEAGGAGGRGIGGGGSAHAGGGSSCRSSLAVPPACGRGRSCKQ